MAFVIPEGLHPDLMPLAWMVGTWRGKGHGEYPGIEPFQFAHEVTFNHDGGAFLTYFSRSWIIDDNNEIIKQSASETGFWRVSGEKKLEVLISHSTGITEGWVGMFDGPKIQLVMDQGYSAPTAKVVNEGQRLYGLVEGELFFAYDMAYGDHKLQAHVWSTMPRSNN
jgi:hypothetical protein